MDLSIVSPVYKAQNLVPILVEEIHEALEPLDKTYEIILVDDGCPNDSWTSICQIAESNSRVRGVKLSRNFGQHQAISAGLESATGEWVVVMDCDLQDDPNEICSLYSKAKEGFSIVLAKRTNRKHSAFKRYLSKLFYFVFSYLTNTSQDPTVGNFGIYNRKVIQSILRMGDHIKYFPAQVQWVGFRKTAIPVRHFSRREGDSTYNLRGLFRLALNNILVFSDKPLRIAVIFGIAVSIVAFCLGTVYLILGLLGIVTVSGFVSLILRPSDEE